MFHIGFTGTRHGWTAPQDAKVKFILDSLLAQTFLPTRVVGHHGDCIGSDAKFHQLCLFHDMEIVMHPPDNRMLRAFCPEPSRERPARPYLVRNRNIVQEADIVLATPQSLTHNAGGTWYTINYALELGRPTIIVDGAGLVVVHNENEVIRAARARS